MSSNRNKEQFSVSLQHYNFAIKVFTEVIKDMHVDQCTFSIHETKTKDVLEDVRSLKSEVGIVSFSHSNEALIKKLLREYQLEFTPLMNRNTYVYVWQTHPLANKKLISIEELKDYPCVTFDQSSTDNFYLSEEAMADYSFDKVIQSDDRATSMELIAQLNAYAIGSGFLSEKDAEKKGVLKEDSVIIEPTSSNAGIGLASITAARGYRIISTIPETMSVERRNILKAYGTQLVLTEGAKGMKGAISKAQELAQEIPNSFIPSQFNNLANPSAYRTTAGPEIYNDTD